MATSVHRSTKMVFEFVDPISRKKTSYSFSNLNPNITETEFWDLANSINKVQDTAYSSLYKIVEAEIF